MKALRRVLVGLAVLALVLAVAVAGIGVYSVRRPFPQTGGEVANVPGLTGPVEIYRDSFGVPHIYAASAHDLFLAQGYVHAQDRFYQMDFWRHQTAGRLAELYGRGVLGTDKFLRSLGWHRLAEQEFAQASAEHRSVMEAYAEGVNAYLAGRPAASLSLEYSILAVNGLAGYEPEPWTPTDSLAWAKAMAWNLGGNLRAEIDRAILLQALGAERLNEYMPRYPGDHPVIVPDPALGALPPEALAQARASLAEVDAVLGGYFEGIGSNNWVVAGSRTTTGRPLLANDPHLSIQMPSIWYEVGLHCQPVSADCPYDAVGFSFAGVPMIIAGHNGRIAWGVTNAGPDVQDLYIERVNPDNPNEYEVDGQWVPMTVATETLAIRGGGSEALTIRSTRHGPLITDIYGLEKFAEQAGLDPAYDYGFALRWTALDPIGTFQSIFLLNRAQNFDDFRAALRSFDAPAQNFVYADVDGNIGYQLPGRIPVRAQGDGRLPVPGWSSEYEWTGYIPFEALPYSYNPPQGYIVTANNAIVGDEYPYLISTDWDPGYRARRLTELIEAQPKISLEYMRDMQADNLNLAAADLLAPLLDLPFEDAGHQAAIHALRDWDHQMTIDSRPAAIYMAYLNQLLEATFGDDLPESLQANGGPGNWQMLARLMGEPANPWWDDTRTPAAEGRDDIVRQAFVAGYAELRHRLGFEPEKWTWGALHTSTFVNETLGRSGIRPIEQLFNRGPFATAGGSSIVNATGWALQRDDADDTVNPYAVRSVPSMRMIVDLGNLAASEAMHTTGQSGHAYSPHYIDMANAWRLVHYHPMLWEAGQVQAAAESRLTLRP